ncbi:MAG: glucose-1-phosphate adenylyltransferase family protein [Actinomycetota bacterium]
MARNRILAIIQAGGAGGRMDVLTRERAKPALPFAGVYQLVDFPLSNLVHSGISDVWLSVQYQGGMLEEEVANGRPWDLDRNHGGLRLVMPQQGTGTGDEEGFATGNADLLFRIRDQIRAADPEVVLVLSADHVYRFDYMDAIETHRAKGAELTIVTTEVAKRQASNHATVEANRLGRVTGFAYKPKRPSTTTVATEIFVYSPDVLVETLEELHRERTADAEPGDSGLGDFGESLVPRLVDRGRVYAHALPGYWRDLGQPHLYLAAHQDLLTGEADELFADPSWPFLTRQPQRVAARFEPGCELGDSLVSPGARVAGVVRRSVLGPGVVVAADAVVSDSVILHDTTIEAGAEVSWSIVDAGCTIGAGARVGDPDAKGTDDPEQVTLVGRDSTVAPGAEITAGARLEPGTTA